MQLSINTKTVQIRPWRMAYHLKNTVLHVAMIIFFADMLASFFPAFEHVWNSVARIAVACAAFFEVFSEHLSFWIELWEKRESAKLKSEPETQAA